jgi:MFS transporter, DHA1 family, inner membrane transport protein
MKLDFRLASLAARPWWPAAVLIAVQIANGAWYLPQLSFFPIYLQEELQLSTVLIAAIVSGPLVSGMFAALAGGAVTGRLGSKRALVLGLVISAVGVLAFQVRAPWLVTTLWFAGGAGLSFITVAGASYLTGLSARGALGVLAAIYSLSLTAGGVIGNPVAGLLIERFGFRVFGLAQFVSIALTGLLAAGLLVALNDRSPRGAAASAPGASARAMLRQPRIQMLIGLRALPTIAYGLMTVLIPLLLNDLSGSKPLVAAYGTANLVIASASQILAGRAADRWGARIPTVIAYVCLVTAGLGLALTANVVAGVFVFGVAGVAAAWSLSTLMYVWVADGVEKPGRPAAFGLLHAVWCLSMIAGSVIGGWLARGASGLPFLVAGLLNLLSPLLVLAYYRRVRPRKPAGATGPDAGAAG